MLHAAFSAWNASTQAISAVPGVVWSLSLEPIITAITKQSVAAGGNVLGLTPPPQGLILSLLSATWENAADDSTMNNAANSLLQNIISASRRTGTFHPYVEHNHAAENQDPITSYGPANKAFLQAVSRKYDPKGVFQTRVPGGFKVF